MLKYAARIVGDREMVVAYALLGLLVGLLLNIVSDRLPKGRGTTIPLRRPMVELATILLFAYLWLLYGPSLQLILVTLYTCLLLLIFIIDLEQRLVLNEVLVPAALLALLAGLFRPEPGLWSALLGGAVGFGFFFTIAVASKGGLGAGDVKLAAVIGLMTGFPQVVIALVIGVSIGGLTALFLLLTRAKGRKSYIPYAPFLVVGAVVALLYGQELVQWWAGVIGS